MLVKSELIAEELFNVVFPCIVPENVVIEVPLVSVHRHKISLFLLGNLIHGFRTFEVTRLPEATVDFAVVVVVR